MNKSTFYQLLSCLLVVLVAAVMVNPVAADDDTPPGKGDSVWAPIVMADGSVETSGLVDLGLQEIPADWMPSNYGFSGNAEYHAYQDPTTGTVYMMPSPITYIFMAANPEESGLIDSVGALSANAESAEYSYATDSAFIAGILSDNISIEDYEEFTAAGYADWGTFFDAILSGEVEQWSLPDNDSFRFLVSLLLEQSLADWNLYSVILAYPPGACAELPGGCPPGMVDLTPPENVVIAPPDCPPSYTSTTAITISGGPGAGDGGKIAPLNPVVVGQDPQRRGVDIQARVVIPPIVYHWFTTLPHTDQVCVEDNVHGTYGTGCQPSNRRFRIVTRTWYECLEHSQVYVDQLSSATISLSLTRESREWILTDLEQAYPGAHLINPDFSFVLAGPGSVQGNSSVIWQNIVPGIQVADPGYWTVTVRVLTTGTPVSGARFQSYSLGEFLDELVLLTLTNGTNP